MLKLVYQAILVTPTGWANAATIDVVYDLLHMMGRDDIPVGLGDYFALGQNYPNFPGIGDCMNKRVIPRGRGGLLDSDTLYGLSRDLPQGSRRYTAENSVKYGAPQTTDHPELRQARALEVWHSVVNSESKVTILTNGPLTTVAKIILSDENTTYPIQEIVIVGGHIVKNRHDYGNVMNIPGNKYSEMNMFLDPLAAKAVFDSTHKITLIPLTVQRSVHHFYKLLGRLFTRDKKTPELLFAESLLERLRWLSAVNLRYGNLHTFSGEILGAVILGGGDLPLRTRYETMKVKVSATGNQSET